MFLQEPPVFSEFQNIIVVKYKKEYMNFLAHSMKNIRLPSNIYYVFLKEQLISYRISMVTMGYNDHIETED